MHHEKLLEAWLAEHKASSAVIYRPVAQKFLAEVALEPSAIQAWAEALEGKTATMSRKVSTVASLLAYAYEHGFIEADLGIALKRPKHASKKAVAIDVSLVQELLGAADKGRDRLLIQVLYELGLSPEAAVQLRFQDITEASPELTQALSEFQGDAEPDRLVFLSYRSKGLTARDARRIVEDIAREAGHEELDTSWLRKAHHWKDPKPVRAWNIKHRAEGPFGIVYGLRDPRTGALKYVGMTRLRLQDRLRCHMSKANTKSRNRAAGWLRGLLAEGLQPVAEVLAVAANRDELLYLERLHISRARHEGHPLVNTTHVWSFRETQKRLTKGLTLV
jgi:hypothetical protein